MNGKAKIRLDVRFGKLSVALVLIVFCVLYGTQVFLFAQNRLGSSVKVGNIDVSFRRLEDAQAIALKQERPLKLTSSAANFVVDAADIGLKVDTNAVAKQLPNPRSLKKLIPLYGLYLSSQPKHIKISYSFDEKQARTYAEKLALFNKQPENAKLLLKDNTIEITPEKQGVKLANDDVYKAISDSVKQGSLDNAKLVVTPIPAEITSEQLLPAKEQYSKVKTHTLMVSIDDRQFTVSPEELISWLEPVPTGLAANTTKLNETISKWTTGIFLPAGITQVSYMDGVEIDRTTGKTGRSIDTDAIRSSIDGWLKALQTRHYHTRATQLIRGSQSLLATQNQVKGYA